MKYSRFLKCPLVSRVSRYSSSADEDRLDGPGSLDYRDGDLASSSQLRDPSGPGEGRAVDRRKCDPGDENLPVSNEDMPDHYMYVVYPPELKRRLLER